jgi:hypothetical protein
MSTILESQYNEPTRPFSQKELKDKQDFLYKKLRIGTVMACHPKCKHFYLTRKNSRKEQDIQANLEDIGNCSVCWKINKTPYNQKHLAQDLVYHYDKEFSNKNDNITHYRQDLEQVFYTWLYEDQNQQRPRRQRVNINDNNDTEAMEAVSV